MKIRFKHLLKYEKYLKLYSDVRSAIINLVQCFVTSDLTLFSVECCRRDQEEEEEEGEAIPDVQRQRSHRRESSAIQHIKIPMVNRKPVKFRCEQMSLFNIHTHNL